MSMIFKKLKQKLTAPLEKSKQKKLDAIYDLYHVQDIQEPLKDTKKVRIFIPELNDYKEVTVESSRQIIKTPGELEEMIKKVERETKQDTIMVNGKEMKRVKIYIPEFNEYKEVLIESGREVLYSPEKFRDILSEISDESVEATQDEMINVNGKQMKKVFIFIPEFNEYKQVLVDADRPIPMSRYSLQQLTQKISDLNNINRNLYNDIYNRIDHLYASIMLDESFPIGEDITKRTYSLFGEEDTQPSPSEFQSDLAELNNETNDERSADNFFNESLENEIDILDQYLQNDNNKDKESIENKYQFLDLYSEDGEQDNKLQSLESLPELNKQENDIPDDQDDVKEYKLIEDYIEEYNENGDRTRSNTEDIIFSTLLRKDNKGKRKSLSRYYD